MTSASAEGWTPGPWRTNGTIVEGPKMALRVGSVYPPQIGNAPRNEQEWQANARLIAAAPDLYEALKHAAAYLADLEYHFHGDTKAMWEPIQTALRKATGEQP